MGFVNGNFGNKAEDTDWVFLGKSHKNMQYPFERFSYKIFYTFYWLLSHKKCTLIYFKTKKKCGNQQSGV